MSVSHLYPRKSNMAMYTSPYQCCLLGWQWSLLLAQSISAQQLSIPVYNMYEYLWFIALKAYSSSKGTRVISVKYENIKIHDPTKNPWKNHHQDYELLSSLQRPLHLGLSLSMLRRALRPDAQEADGNAALQRGPACGLVLWRWHRLEAALEELERKAFFWGVKDGKNDEKQRFCSL